MFLVMYEARIDHHTAACQVLHHRAGTSSCGKVDDRVMHQTVVIVAILVAFTVVSVLLIINRPCASLLGVWLYNPVLHKILHYLKQVAARKPDKCLGTHVFMRLTAYHTVHVVQLNITRQEKPRRPDKTMLVFMHDEASRSFLKLSTESKDERLCLVLMTMCIDLHGGEAAVSTGALLYQFFGYGYGLKYKPLPTEMHCTV
jgi:hypothetical protein